MFFAVSGKLDFASSPVDILDVGFFIYDLDGAFGH